MILSPILVILLHVYHPGHPVGDLLGDIPHGKDPGSAEELNITLHVIFQLLFDNIQIRYCHRILAYFAKSGLVALSAVVLGALQFASFHG